MNWRVHREPHGVPLEKLLRHAVARCETAVAIVRQELTPRGDRDVARLRPFLRGESFESAWPSGWTVGSTKVLVLRYAFSLDFVTAAMACNDSLFAWRNPWSLEDLSLLRPGGTPWLVTNSYEHRATLALEPSEIESLATQVPEVTPIVGSDGTIVEVHDGEVVRRRLSTAIDRDDAALLRCCADNRRLFGVYECLRTSAPPQDTRSEDDRARKSALVDRLRGLVERELVELTHVDPRSGRRTALDRIPEEAVRSFLELVAWPLERPDSFEIALTAIGDALIARPA
jgi:hypothetical protein